jgi:hypothetical protein
MLRFRDHFVAIAMNRRFGPSGIAMSRGCTCERRAEKRPAGPVAYLEGLQEKKGKGPKASLQRQPEHPLVMMESDALQSGGKKKMDHYEPPTGSP